MVSIEQWLFCQTSSVFGKWFISREVEKNVKCEYTGNTIDIIQYMDRNGRWNNHLSETDYFHSYEEALWDYEKYHGEIRKIQLPMPQLPSNV